MSKSNAIPLGAGGIPDAPADGFAYGRLDGDWNRVVELNSVSAVLNPNGGAWINLVSWSTIIGTPPDYGVGASFTFFGRRVSDGHVIFGSRVNAFGDRRSKTGVLSVTDRIASYDVPGTAAVYRVVFEDENDINSPFHIQFYSGLNEDIRWTVINQFNAPYEQDVTFGDLSVYTPLATEFSPEDIDVSDWQESDIYSGHTGGIRAQSIGGINSISSRFEFSEDRIEHYVGDSLTLESTAEGSIVSGSAAGTFGSPERIVDTATFPNTSIDGSEFESIGVEVLDEGIVYRPTFKNHAGGGTGISVFASSNSAERIGFRIPDWLSHGGDIRVSIVARCQSSSDTYEATIALFDERGIQTNTDSVQGSGDNAETFEARLLFPPGSQTVYVGAADGSTVQVGIRSYIVELELVEPALDNDTVLRTYSHTRAFELPGLVDNNIKEYRDGLMRMHPVDRIPQIRRSGAWNYVSSARFGVHTSPHFVSYYADVNDGSYSAQGWVDDGRAQDKTIVNDQYGYPTLLRIQDPVSSFASGIYHTLDDATLQSMRSNGWRWDFTMRVDGGAVFNWLQATSAYNGTAGRWIFNVNVFSGSIVVSDNSGTGNSADLGNIDKFVRFSIQCDPNTDTAQLYANGEFLFDLGFQTLANTEGRLFHTSGSSASADEDYWLLDSVFFSLDSTTRNLTRQEIEGNIRYNIPTVENTVNVTVPKGTFSLGTTFSVVNGSSKDAIVQGVDGDPQLFAGSLSFAIPPYHEVTFTQTAHLRGNVWTTDVRSAVEPAPVDNHLRLSINAGATAVLDRKGNWTGNVTFSARQAGRFNMEIDGVTLPVNTPVLATVNNDNPDGGRYSVAADRTLNGFIHVVIRDTETDTNVNQPVTVDVIW